MNARDRIFVALDTPDERRARELVETLVGRVGGFKVGLELFIACGPALVREWVDRGVTVFLDLKLHDIPNTVAGAAASATRLGATFLTVHALGGADMIARGVEASRDAAASSGRRAPVILAVTVLTSHGADDLARIGLAGSPTEAVARLAALARDAGADGAVCSPEEVAAVRRVFPDGTLVVPGIRSAGGAVRSDDQQRIATPSRAVAMGADRIVVGRPVTRASDPMAAVDAIAREIESGFAA